MTYLNHQQVEMHKYFNVPRVKHSCYEATTKNNTFHYRYYFFPYFYHSYYCIYCEGRRYCGYSQNTCIRTEHINRMESCTPCTQYCFTQVQCSYHALSITFSFFHTRFVFINTPHGIPSTRIFSRQKFSTTESAAYDDDNNNVYWMCKMCLDRSIIWKV